MEELNRKKPKLNKGLPVLALLFSGLFILLALFLTKVMMVDAIKLRNQAESQLVNQVVLPARRGDIVDRSGNLLATSAAAYRVDADLILLRRLALDRDEIEDLTAADHQKIEEYAGLYAPLIAPFVQMTAEEVYSALTRKTESGRYLAIAVLGKKLEISDLAAIKQVKADNKLRWLLINDDTKRYYPNNNLLAQSLGIVSGDDKGLFGLELVYDDYLKGVEGVKISEVDRRDDDIPLSEPIVTNPVDGARVVLTIDEKIQAIVENEAGKALEAKKAEGVTIIVTRPSTGEILALVNSPDFDLNEPFVTDDGVALQEIWRNNAISDSFEPGSTFKMVTMIAAISEHLVDGTDKFYCPGYVMVDGVRINCAVLEGHGTQDFYQIMQNSCNPGFVELGLRLGPDKLLEYAKKLGFGSLTGIDMPGEAEGILMDPADARKVDLAAMAIGQTNSATALQMINGLNTILNHGRVTTPHLVKEIIKTDGNNQTVPVYTFTEQHTEDVLDDQASDQLISLMEETVNKGGSVRAKVDGVRVLGKTGTAQKLNPETGKYEFWVSSFIGAAPVEDPKISIFIAVDTPTQGTELAGIVSAPIAGTIFREVLKYLHSVEAIQ